MDGTRMKLNQKKNHKMGYTMVETMISFGILMMLGAVFANIFFFAGRMTRDTAQALEGYEEFAKDYYLQEELNRELVAEGELLFLQKGEEGENGLKQFKIDGVRLYRNTNREGKARQIYDVDGNWEEE